MRSCMQIIVADDEPDIRSTMKMILEQAGHTVDVAANGHEAVDIATRRVPHVIVMDLNMPVMDGLSATRLLRERPETKAVTVVCLSAYLRESDWLIKARSAGCDHCLSKPVDWDILSALLSSLHD
jgi:CheY-like chemotaxis protein